MWQSYKPYTNDSGIIRFGEDNESISVEYKNGKRYRFSISTHGAQHVAKMKELATVRRSGLTRYINEHKLTGEVLPSAPRYT